MRKLILKNSLAAAVSAAVTLSGASQMSHALELEEVVVTAQKREQSSQDIPIAITAFTGDRLDDLGLTNSNEIAAKVPNLDIASPTGEGGVAVVFIRGVGLNDFATNNTGPIGMYVDEVYAGSSNGQVTMLYDIERLEVLKGPQGTLYGRNTTGGALNIISRAPTEELEGYIRGTYGDFDSGENETKLEGAVSGPLTDDLRGRLAFVKYDSDGYMKNLTSGDYVEKDIYAWRGRLDWTPTDRLDFALNIHSSRNDSDSDIYGNSESGTDFREEFANITPELDVDQDGASLKIGYGLTDSIELLSITAYDELDKEQAEDADASNATLVHTFFGVETDTFSQEFRVLGDTEHSNWILGAFYWDDDLTQDQWVDLQDTGLPTPSVYNNEQETTTWAVFGQTEYSINEQWVVTAGLRYTQLDVDFDYTGTAFLMADTSTDPLTVIVPGEWNNSDSLDDDSVSGKLGLSWMPGDELMVYGTLSKGFKGAGFNGNFIVDPFVDQDYDSEDLLAYEIGFKSTLLEGLMQFNGAAFYYDYSDAQVFNNAPVPLLGLPSNTIRNADVTQYGGELDLTWAPVDGLFLQLGLGYTDATYDEDVDDPVTGLLEIDGNRVQNTPEWSAFGLVNYEWDLGNVGSLSAQLDATYTDDVYYSAFEDSVIGQDAYTITNARLAYKTADESVEVAVWGKNLSDKEYSPYAFDLRADFGFVQEFFGRPRTLGVDITYCF